MRLINVSCPLGKGEEISRIAYQTGIEKVSVQREEIRRLTGPSEIKEIVKVETSSPKGKRFVDNVLKADFFNVDEFSIVTRSALSIISKEQIKEITRPLPETAIDILEELFQFSHITYSFIGRIFIAGLLLAYGLIRQNLLTMIAGLLFLPLLPLLQAIGFGTWTKQWKLAFHGLLGFITATILLILAGIFLAYLTGPPLKYDEFNSLGASFLISLAVGIAAGLAIIDDVGKREMIGLAASAQIAIVPVWTGICLVFGFPVTTGENEIKTRIISFFINILTIIVAALVVHIFAGTANGALQHLKKDTKDMK